MAHLTHESGLGDKQQCLQPPVHEEAEGSCSHCQALTQHWQDHTRMLISPSQMSEFFFS